MDDGPAPTTTRLGTVSTDCAPVQLDPTLPQHRPAEVLVAAAAAAVSSIADFAAAPVARPPSPPTPQVLPPPNRRRLPSSAWTSFQYWNYGGFRERLESFLAAVDRQVFVDHVQRLTGQTCTVSEPFSAGQYWCCFELVAGDGQLYIARARLPPHPNQQMPPHVARHRAENEIATMRLVRQRTSIPVPEVYAYEREGTPLADAAGAPYMLLQGFYGNSLLERTHDLSGVQDQSLRRLLHQWASYVVELSTISFPRIGGVCEKPDAPGEFDIGPLATEEAGVVGPFDSAHDYYKALAHGSLQHALRQPWKLDDESHHLKQTAPAIVCDVVQKAPHLFSAPGRPDDAGPFALHHMDLGIHNILVDDCYNIVAFIDWELASTAPATADFFPAPFAPPLDIEADRKILRNPSNRRFASLKREYAMRKFFTDGLRDGESAVRKDGRKDADAPNLMELFQSPASKAYYYMERQGRVPIEDEEAHMRALVRLAFGLREPAEVEAYFVSLEAEAQRLTREHARQRMVVRRQQSGKHPWWHASL